MLATMALNVLDGLGFKEAYMRPAGRLPRIRIQDLPEKDL